MFLQSVPDPSVLFMADSDSCREVKFATKQVQLQHALKACFFIGTFLEKSAALRVGREEKSPKYLEKVSLSPFSPIIQCQVSGLDTKADRLLSAAEKYDLRYTLGSPGSFQSFTSLTFASL